MKNNKRIAYVVIIVMLLLGGVASLFSIEIASGPPDETRIIVEHTHRTYIAPPCFEQAETTNNLGETTWAEAQELGYDPESACTEEALAVEPKPIISVLLEKSGFSESKWDW